VVREGLDGAYVPMRDAGALKEKMLHFYNHREQVARMGANAAERARFFTWDRFSRQVGDILSAVKRSQTAKSEIRPTQAAV
jgi:glycosyltransferase involved in cell wall biosynthesis